MGYINQRYINIFAKNKVKYLWQTDTTTKRSVGPFIFSIWIARKIKIYYDAMRMVISTSAITQINWKFTLITHEYLVNTLII